MKKRKRWRRKNKRPQRKVVLGGDRLCAVLLLLLKLPRLLLLKLLSLWLPQVARERWAQWQRPAQRRRLGSLGEKLQVHRSQLVRPWLRRRRGDIGPRLRLHSCRLQTSLGLRCQRTWETVSVLRSNALMALMLAPVWGSYFARKVFTFQRQFSLRSGLQPARTSRWELVWKRVQVWNCPTMSSCIFFSIASILPLLHFPLAWHHCIFA